MELNRLRLKSIYCVLLIFAVLFLCTGAVLADTSIDPTPETQGIKTTTSMQGQLAISKNSELAWQLSSTTLDTTLDPLGGSFGIPDYGTGVIIFPEPLSSIFNTPGEKQYIVSYTESTGSSNGNVDYSKTMNVDTARKVLGGSNVQAHRNVQFSAPAENPLSTLTSQEQLMVDGVGALAGTGDTFLCPFAASAEFIPEFCNIVQSGSSVAVTSGSFITDASERHVQIADFPVEVTYNMQLKGMGGEPAAGSVSSFMKVHAQEGRVDVSDELYDPITDTAFFIIEKAKAGDFTYNENEAASGLINGFNTQFYYQSGMVRI
jgi:hypothetical protein